VNGNIVTAPFPVPNRKRVSRSFDATCRARWPMYRQKCRFNSHRYSLSNTILVDKRARYVRDLFPSLSFSPFSSNKQRSLRLINARTQQFRVVGREFITGNGLHVPQVLGSTLSFGPHTRRKRAENMPRLRHPTSSCGFRSYSFHSSIEEFHRRAVNFGRLIIRRIRCNVPHLGIHLGISI
jgi:hypothetical protein